MKTLFEQMFPLGLSEYGTDELKDVESKIAIEVQSRLIEKSISEEAADAIRNSENIDEYIGMAKTYPTLKDLSDDELHEMWEEYWSQMAEGQKENEYMDEYYEETDFSAKEEDMVK